MKKMTIITLALALMVSISLTDNANAGWFGKDDDSEKTNEAHRFELFPSMSFYQGTIRQDTYAGWRLDEYSLQLAGNGTVVMDGSDEGYLQEGRTAIVMGVKYGKTLVAWHVRVLKPDNGYQQRNHLEKVELGPNSQVGVGTGPM